MVVAANHPEVLEDHQWNAQEYILFQLQTSEGLKCSQIYGGINDPVTPLAARPLRQMVQSTKSSWVPRIQEHPHVHPENQPELVNWWSSAITMGYNMIK